MTLSHGISWPRDDSRQKYGEKVPATGWQKNTHSNELEVTEFKGVAGRRHIEKLPGGRAEQSPPGRDFSTPAEPNSLAVVRTLLQHTLQSAVGWRCFLP
jgi:hypothetical protein